MTSFAFKKYRRAALAKRFPKKLTNEITIALFHGNLARDDCFYCDVPFDETNPLDRLTLDHIIARSFFGDNEEKDTLRNLLSACWFCNQMKQSMDFFSFCDFAEKVIKPHRRNFEAMRNAIRGEDRETKRMHNLINKALHISKNFQNFSCEPV